MIHVGRIHVYSMVHVIQVLVQAIIRVFVRKNQQANDVKFSSNPIRSMLCHEIMFSMIMTFCQDNQPIFGH